LEKIGNVYKSWSEVERKTNICYVVFAGKGKGGRTFSERSKKKGNLGWKEKKETRAASRNR